MSEGVFNEPAANFNSNVLARNELLRDSQLSADAVQAAGAHSSLEAGAGAGFSTFEPTTTPTGGHPHPGAEVEKVVSTHWNRVSAPDVRSSEEERESANRERSGSRVSEAMMAVAPRAGMKLSAHLTIYEHDATSYSCYVWKKSKFYSKMRVSSQAWQLR